MQVPARFKTFVELKDYVYTTLCHREQLSVGAFPMVQQQLRRGESICGFLFSVYGPRNVVFNAVFETQRNAIHFYNSAGERFLTTSVGVAPPVST